MGEIPNKDQNGKARVAYFKVMPWALRAIRAACDRLTFLNDCLATYLVICELCNDERSNSFTGSRRKIVERSGTSLRQIDRVLTVLESCGVVTVKQNYLDGTKSLSSSTYTLRTDGATSRPTGATLRQEQFHHLGAVIEEGLEAHVEEGLEEGRSAVASPASCDDSQWIAGLKADPAYQGIDVDREHAKMRRWCDEHRKQPTRRRFINWLNRADRPIQPANAQKTASRFTDEILIAPPTR